MADIDKLRAELVADPLLRGYAGMTNTQAVQSIRAVNRSVERPTVSGSEVFNAVVPAEFDALLVTQQGRVRDVWGLGDAIDVRSGTSTRAVLLSAFGAGTTTRANLIAVVTRTVSRADELGLGAVFEGDVARARA